jgi:hypothetical protein
VFEFNVEKRSNENSRLFEKINELEEPHRTACATAYKACYAVAYEPAVDRKAFDAVLASRVVWLVHELKSTKKISSSEELVVDIKDLLRAVAAEKNKLAAAESSVLKFLSNLDVTIGTYEPK